MKTLEDCKQQIADKYGYTKWSTLVADIFIDHKQEDQPRIFDEYYFEVTELYAQHLANEKVREERGIVGHTETMKQMIMESPIGDIIKLPDVIEVKQDKKGGRITFGAPVDLVNKLFIENGKWVIEAWVIRHSEYVRALSTLENRGLPFPEVL
jgi:hypothetical protein